MADLDGIAHMRTTRGAYPVLYDATATFTVGGSKVLRESGDDQVTLIGAGPTELVVAHLAVRELPGSGTSAELLDAAGISAEHIAAAARQLLG
jgi:transketolase